MVNKAYVPRKGDIVWLNFTPQAGHEQRGRRLGLVMSSDSYNRSGLMLVCPITSSIKGYPFEVRIKTEDGTNGVVLADHLKNQDWKARKVQFQGKAHKDTMEMVRNIIAALLIK
jgi:mRNA interferase MazF